MAIIITDSTSDLTYEQTKQWGVEMIPLTVQFGEEHYKDKIELSNLEFYNKLESSEVLPTTSLLNPQDFLDYYEQYPNEDLIVITLSHRLSGTYQSAVIAKEMTERENIYVIDSKSVTIAQGLLVKAAVELNKQQIPTIQMVERLMELRDSIRLVAVIDTLKYLIKGGRLGSVQGAIGSALKLKPIIRIIDGEILTLGKARGTKAAFKEVQAIMESDLAVDEAMPISYAHSNCEEMVQTFQEKIGYQGDTYMIGSVVGTHAGPGAVAIAYFAKEVQ